jgi:hypothetical protein
VVPPLACSRFEYVVPCVPDGTLDVVTVKAVGATTSESLTVWVCTGLDESTTLNVKLVVLLAVGVPEIFPVAFARLRPLGRVPAVIDHV